MTVRHRLQRLFARRPAQLALIGVTLAAYLLAYEPLHARIGLTAGLLAIVPVILTGWYFGKLGGLLAGMATPLINTFLVNLTGQSGWDVIFRQSGGLGPIAAVGLGLIIGHWSDLARA